MPNLTSVAAAPAFRCSAAIEDALASYNLPYPPSPEQSTPGIATPTRPWVYHGRAYYTLADVQRASGASSAQMAAVRLAGVSFDMLDTIRSQRGHRPHYFPVWLNGRRYKSMDELLPALGTRAHATVYAWLRLGLPLEKLRRHLVFRRERGTWSREYIDRRAEQSTQSTPTLKAV